MAKKPRATVYKRVAISRKKKTRYARSSSVPLKFRQYVMRTLHTNAENKQRVNYGANQPLTLGNSSTQTLPLLIGALQGVDDQTRNGNSIRIRKGVWRGVFNLLPYNATTNPYVTPIWVKLWVVKDLKLQGQQSSIDGTNFGKFFRQGNASVGLQYTPIDLTLDVNRDQFRVLWSRTFKLGSAGIFAANAPVNSSSYFDNSSSSKMVTINYGKWIKKQLKFDDNNSQWPTNANLYLVMQSIPQDGTQTAVNTQLVEYHYTNTQAFEDL